MKPVIKFEFYRAFRSGGFYVALLLGTALAIGDIVLFHNAFRDTIDTKVVMQTWIGTDYQFVTNSLFLCAASDSGSITICGNLL